MQRRWRAIIGGVDRNSIVVGTDGSNSAQASVRQAAALAAADGARLTIVAAYRRRRHEAQAAAARALQRASAEAAISDIDAELLVVPGSPSRVLCEVARRIDADLIVVGNRGVGEMLSFIQRPICDRVARRAPCDVLVADTRPYWWDIDEESRLLALEHAEPVVVRIDHLTPGPRVYLNGLRIHHGLSGELLTLDAIRRRTRVGLLEGAVGLALLATDWRDFPFPLIDR